MKVDVIDNKTYVVGDTVFETGDKLDLTVDEAKLLGEFKQNEKDLADLKQALITACHLSTRNFDMEISKLAHQLNGLAIRHSYVAAAMLHQIHSRLGGLLPIAPTADRTVVEVRERSFLPGGEIEEINYTVATVKRSTGMIRMEDQRLLAVALAGKAESVTIDFSASKRYRFQPIEFTTTGAIGDPDVVLANMKKAVESLLDKRVQPTNTLVLFKTACLSPTGDTINGAVINMTVNDPVRVEGIKSYAAGVCPTVAVSIVRTKADSLRMDMRHGNALCSVSADIKTGPDGRAITWSAPLAGIPAGDNWWTTLVAVPAAPINGAAPQK